ncbi:SprA protein [Babesia caballi]|uniref:SprA protein n=1 Tax=Babesia caballi TaxID=5871 RepID=A0AAV4LX28_BABCB|nr:SprA protein [Babesia caballi]
MPIDYSKWDNLAVSDSDDDTKPHVIKLDPSQRVELGRGGYKILSGGASAGRRRDLSALSKFWKHHVKNGTVVVRSHAFSQDRYDICLLIAVRPEGRSRFEVTVTESDLQILCAGRVVFHKEFYAKVRSGDDFVNWQVVRQEVDWNALETYCESAGSGGPDAEITFTELYEQTFVEIELKKQTSIQDCFIWWPKAFKVRSHLHFVFHI